MTGASRPRVVGPAAARPDRSDDLGLVRVLGVRGTVRWGCRALLMIVVALVLAGCASTVTGSVVSSAGTSAGDGDAWVVVTYPVADGDPAMMKLLPTETAADDALQAAGVGSIDGNEVGQGVYEMYFVGDDAREMWTVLEPVLARGPLRWQKVELRDGLEDPTPTVIAP